MRSKFEGMQGTIKSIERRVESMEHALTLRNAEMAGLEEYVRQQELSSYDGVLHWKITEFERRRNEAVSGQQVPFYSPCFSTSRHGYKMCACIYLNGDGMGRGTHISVFFVVMRGQYDVILRWPFRIIHDLAAILFLLLPRPKQGITSLLYILSWLCLVFTSFVVCLKKLVLRLRSEV